MKTALRELLLVLRNTALVTATVIGGFVFGSAIGIPGWLQVICLIPAALLFAHLTGEAIRPMGRWLPLVIAAILIVLVVTGVMQFLRLHFPDLSNGWHALIFASLLFFSPSPPVLAEKFRKALRTRLR